jgi:hypothetical protein
MKTRTFTIDNSSLQFDLCSVVHLAHTAIALRSVAMIRETGAGRSWTFGPADRRDNGMTHALLGR